MSFNTMIGGASALNLALEIQHRSIHRREGTITHQCWSSGQCAARDSNCPYPNIYTTISAIKNSPYECNTEEFFINDAIFLGVVSADQILIDPRIPILSPTAVGLIDHGLLDRQGENIIGSSSEDQCMRYSASMDAHLLSLITSLDTWVSPCLIEFRD